MSESLSINNAEFNSVISDARQLARLLERRSRAYDNTKNSLSGVEQSNRNNISQAVNDLERKSQELQSKKESLDEFIRTVTEFREDTNNTERDVSSRFSSDTSALLRLNSIRPAQIAIHMASRNVVTIFTAFLGMGRNPGMPNANGLRTFGSSRPGNMPLFGVNTSRAPTPALPTPTPTPTPESPPHPGSAPMPQPRPESSPPENVGGTADNGTRSFPGGLRNWGSFVQGFLVHGVGFVLESRTPPQNPDTLSAGIPLLYVIRKARDMFELIYVIIDRVESIDQLAEILGEAIPEALWGNLSYIRENFHRFGDMDSLSPEEAREFGIRAASAYRELVVLGFLAKGGIKYVTSKIKKALPAAKPPGDAAPPMGAGNIDEIKRQLASGKSPNDLIKAGHSVDDIIRAGANINDIPAFKHMTLGEGVARGNKPGVKGAHNMDSFKAAIDADAKRLGIHVDKYNIRKTPHPTIEGVYEIKYDIVKENGLGRVLKDANGNIQVRPAFEVKTVYDPAVISDKKMYDMARRALDPQVNNMVNPTGIVTGEYNGLKFRGHLNSDGKFISLYPIFE